MCVELERDFGSWQIKDVGAWIEQTYASIREEKKVGKLTTKRARELGFRFDLSEARGAETVSGVTREHHRFEQNLSAQQTPCVLR